MKKRPALVAPADLDEVALAKWNELQDQINDTQAPMLANLCRNHTNLLDVRQAKAAAIAAGTFTAMVTAKNGALVVHPIVRAETRLLGLETRMLLSLGIGFDHFY